MFTIKWVDALGNRNHRTLISQSLLIFVEPLLLQPFLLNIFE